MSVKGSHFAPFREGLERLGACDAKAMHGDVGLFQIAVRTLCVPGCEAVVNGLANNTAVCTEAVQMGGCPAVWQCAATRGRICRLVVVRVARLRSCPTKVLGPPVASAQPCRPCTRQKQAPKKGGTRPPFSGWNRLTAAAGSAHCSESNWPGPAWRCRPAAGSACGSARRFLPRSRYPGYGCARPTGFRWWWTGWRWWS